MRRRDAGENILLQFEYWSLQWNEDFPNMRQEKNLGAVSNFSRGAAFEQIKNKRKIILKLGPISLQQPPPPPPYLHAFSPLPSPMSLFSTISVRRSGEERFVRNTYLAQRQSPVPTPFISPGDGIQYTKTPSCSSITPVLGIRAGLPGNWLVVDEHKVWDYPWRSGDYRKGWRDWVTGSQ